LYFGTVYHYGIFHCVRSDITVLANVNSRSLLLYAVARPSSVCRLSETLVYPIHPVEIFGNIFTPFGAWYLDHRLTSTVNFAEIVPGEPLRRGS